MFLHDFCCIGRCNVAVPDGFGIHNNRVAMLALIQTARFVDAYARAEIGGLHILLQLRKKFARTIHSAGWAWSTGGTLIGTDKDMTLENGQRKSS